MVRLRGRAPAALVPTLHQTATSVDPTLQLLRVSPLGTMYAERGYLMALLAIVVGLIMASVLLLSAAGIHALMSFTVNQRRREIGVRAAPGAGTGLILAGILSRATRQFGLGVGAGSALAVAIGRVSGGSVMSGQGLVLVPAIALLMVVVGLLAASAPARRGLRVEPTEALRAEWRTDR